MGLEVLLNLEHSCWEKVSDTEVKKKLLKGLRDAFRNVLKKEADAEITALDIQNWYSQVQTAKLRCDQILIANQALRHPWVSGFEMECQKNM